MKLEVGKLYKTRSKHLVRLIDKRRVHEDDTTNYFLGIIEGGLPETFWYSDTGRLYNMGISPHDIEREILTKLEFQSTFLTSNGRLNVELPKKEIEDLLGRKVKITVEYVNE
jgi:hypothetical protein